MTTLADAIPTLASVDTLEGFNAWWAPRVTAINRASVTDPAEYERIAKAIEAMHERRRAKEREQLNEARDAALREVGNG